MSVTRHESVPVVQRVTNAIASYIGFGADEEPATLPTPVNHAPQPHVQTGSAPRSSRPHKWQRHAQLRAYTPPIAPDVREARRLAVRGLYAVRQNAPEAGLNYFTEAARCREVDLTAVPGFWELTRGQMMVAVEAYDRVERYRDMAALDAQIATIFRPTLIDGASQPIAPLTMKRNRANGD